MNTFHVAQGAAVARKIVDEHTNPIEELQAFDLRQRDAPAHQVPFETDEGGDEKEFGITLLFVPRHAKRSNASENLCTVVCIGWARGGILAGKEAAEHLEVILVFQRWEDALSLKDVDHCICDHTSIAGRNG